MRHFPIFADLKAARVVVVGGQDVAVAKLRLLLKTEAELVVVDPNPCGTIEDWAGEQRLTLHSRTWADRDFAGARLVYAATEDGREDAFVAKAARAAHALVNCVDNLEGSDFITPAIVDRDPVCVAIGTEGAAPVLARAIKADVERKLDANIGLLARIAAGFRDRAEQVPAGKPRRQFWSRFFFEVGPKALKQGRVDAALEGLVAQASETAVAPGRVSFVGAGPGDPDLLTQRAARLLHDADVVLHDQLVSPQVLELARREAIVVNVGKRGFRQSWKQDDINAEMVKHGNSGHHVVRLKGGDPSTFGRLDEEIDTVRAAGLDFDVVPGISAANAAAAEIGKSLTSRGRNTSYRSLTAHDLNGFADQDWKALAAPGSVAAIYMGKRAAKFVSGRLMMFGASASTPVSIVENVSLPNARVIASCVADLGSDMENARCTGPVVMLLGIDAESAELRAGLEKGVAL